jgi:hypothetical protein
MGCHALNGTCRRSLWNPALRQRRTARDCVQARERLEYSDAGTVRRRCFTIMSPTSERAAPSQLPPYISRSLENTRHVPLRLVVRLE